MAHMQLVCTLSNNQFLNGISYLSFESDEYVMFNRQPNDDSWPGKSECSGVNYFQI